ncbi:MAG: pirin family protein [Fusobacteria bacterium]|nr:pirin family protein [Fusobacteriota bacterium]
MIKKIEAKKMGKSDLGWLKSHFHFSFAEYYNPKNTCFGVLRVLNDDVVNPQTGFDMHPHKDMEIISYVVEGRLTHVDSMGNKSHLNRGEVQYISAGTGVFHSEHNLGQEMARLLQIWIIPDKKNHQPNYGEHRFEWDLRKNTWLHLVSSYSRTAPIKVHQDVNIYALELEEECVHSFNVLNGRQAYLVQIQGESLINKMRLEMRDALEIQEELISIEAIVTSHFLLIEMAKDD